MGTITGHAAQASEGALERMLALYPDQDVDLRPATSGDPAHTAFPEEVFLAWREAMRGCRKPPAAD